MQNLWLKRCNCGKAAVEFRSRKDLYVDSVKHLYCPKCIKEIMQGSLVVNIKKWGSSTAKESDRGLYGILYNKEAIHRRNKELGWSNDDIEAVFESGMVTPNLLSIMKKGVDFEILGVFSEGENIKDYKKKLHRVKGINLQDGEDKDFDGKLYDSSLEEPLDRIAGGIDFNSQGKVDELTDESNLVLDVDTNGKAVETQQANGMSGINNIAENIDSFTEKIVGNSDDISEVQMGKTEEENKSGLLAPSVRKDLVVDLENNTLDSEIEEKSSEPIFPNRSNG